MDHRGTHGRNHEYQDSNDSASTPDIVLFSSFPWWLKTSPIAKINFPYNMFDTNKYYTLTLVLKYCLQIKGNEKKKWN